MSKNVKCFEPGKARAKFLPNRFVLSENGEIHVLERSAVCLLLFQYAIGNAEVLTDQQNRQTKACGKASHLPTFLYLGSQ